MQRRNWIAFFLSCLLAHHYVLVWTPTTHHADDVPFPKGHADMPPSYHGRCFRCFLRSMTPMTMRSLDDHRNMIVRGFLQG